MDEQADLNIRKQHATIKRRGILAAAGMAVTALVAKQNSQPVAASYTLQGDTTNASTTTTTITGSIDPSTGTLQVINTIASSGVALVAHCDSAAYGFGIQATGTGYGIQGTGNAYAGVFGDTSGDTAVGVEGLARSSLGGIGVSGTCDAATGIGVQGISAKGIGVEGQCDALGGIGVIGASAAGVGVKGAAATGFPVIGQITGPTTANAGVLGVGTAGPGVQGQSTGGHGLVGTTAATDGVHAALIGSVQPASNAIALRGSVQAGAVGYAGLFDGDVIINGALRVFGSPKNAAVKHPGDGTYRLLYCMESPESWFEDFGTGHLVQGTATIMLDPDFTALVHPEEYLVYVTPQGESNGLYVTDQTAVGFTVREQQGGMSSVGFAYRVVAKRKDIAGERLAKVAPPPPLTPVTPFTVPETPKGKPPTKKP